MIAQNVTAELSDDLDLLDRVDPKIGYDIQIKAKQFRRVSGAFAHDRDQLAGQIGIVNHTIFLWWLDLCCSGIACIRARCCRFLSDDRVGRPSGSEVEGLPMGSAGQVGKHDLLLCLEKVGHESLELR